MDEEIKNWIESESHRIRSLWICGCCKDDPSTSQHETDDVSARLTTINLIKVMSNCAQLIFNGSDTFDTILSPALMLDCWCYYPKRHENYARIVLFFFFWLAAIPPIVLWTRRTVQQVFNSIAFLIIIHHIISTDRQNRMDIFDFKEFFNSQTHKRNETFYISDD